MGIIAALPVQVQYEDQKQRAEPDLFKCDDLVWSKIVLKPEIPHSQTDRGETRGRNGSGTLHSCPCSVFKAPLTWLHRGPVLPSFPRACEALWIWRLGAVCVYKRICWEAPQLKRSTPLHGTNTPARRTSKSINSGEWCFLLSSCCCFFSLLFLWC